MNKRFVSDSIGLCRGDGKVEGCGHMGHTNADNFCNKCWRKLKKKEAKR